MPGPSLHPLVASVGLLAAAASAQSLNIDFDEFPGEAGSAPLATFGGALGQPGLWNAVPASGRGQIELLDLTGTSRGVMYDRIGGEGGFTFDSPNTTGEYHFLLDDLIDVGFVGGSMQIRLTGLVPGRYRVITYAISPDNPTTDRTSISITNALGNNPQLIGGSMPVNAFAGGITHADHTVDVASGFLLIQATATMNYGSVNGLQIALVSPRRLYVKPDAPPGGDGTGWPLAYRTLGEALARAAASQDTVKEIWVARGTYRPSETDPAATFTIPRGVRVYGGFEGTETSLSRRDPVVFRTILSGQLSGGARSRRVAVIDAGPSPYLHPVAALDGLTIEDGGTGAADTGGVRIIGEGELLRCTLRGHTGGALRVDGAATLVLCDFLANSGGDGAAISASGFVTAVDCMLHANTAAGTGGAIYLGGGGELTGTAIWGNTAAQGGGAFAAAGSLTLTNCTIALNQAGSGGGVVVGAATGLAIHNSVIFGGRESGPNPAPLREQNLSVAAWPSGIVGSQNLVEGYTSGPLLLTSGADPVFVDVLGPDGLPRSGDENVSLNTGSPAIDAGDTPRLPRDSFDLDYDGDTNEPLSRDAANQERLTDDEATPDTGCCTAPVVDLGAIEFTPPLLCPADFNQDGGVDGQDVEAFFLVWQEGESRADVNHDGGVDGADVETFYIAWEAGGC